MDPFVACIVWCVMGGLTVAVLDVVWPMYDDTFIRSLFAGVAWPLTMGFLVAYAAYRIGKRAVRYVAEEWFSVIR